jgi:hypothetical protein
VKNHLSRRLSALVLTVAGSAGCALGLLGSPAAADEPAPPLPGDLSITKTGPPVAGPVIGELHYQITITNKGPVDLPGWTVRDAFGQSPGPIGNPDLSSLTSSDPRCSVQNTPGLGNELVCSGGPLAARQSTTIEVDGNWRTGVAAVLNKATVQGMGITDPVTGNNQASVRTDIITEPPSPIPLADPAVAGAAAAAAVATAGAISLARRRNSALR